VNTVGLVVTVVVHAADRQDRDEARLVVGNVHGKQSRVRVMWDDGGDAGQVVEWAQHVGGSGHWTAASVPLGYRTSTCCRDAGWWNGPLPGWERIVACIRTTTHAPIRAKRS